MRFRRGRLDALVLPLVLLLGLAHEVRSQCPNNAQLPGGATQWTSCACNAGYTNTSGLMNLARACSAGACTVTTSSVLAGDTPGSKAVNGITTDAFISLSETNPWLIIDFEQPVFVSSVRIYNRWDCCQDRLNNFEIRVGYAGTSSTFSSNPTCASNQPTFSGDKNFSCILNGRY